MGSSQHLMNDVADAVLDFRVPPKPHLSRVVREGVTDFASAHGIGDEDLAHFLTALGEALANAIEHARAEGPIAIEIRVSPFRIVGTVQDNGIGFTADDSCTADGVLPSIDSERGRGLPIMRRCSDIFAITSEPGRGTAVLIGRYVRTNASETASVA